MAAIDVWYTIEDGNLYRTEENDGARYVRKGAERTKTLLCTVEQAAGHYPRELAKAYPVKSMTAEQKDRAVVEQPKMDVRPALRSSNNTECSCCKDVITDARVLSTARYLILCLVCYRELRSGKIENQNISFFGGRSDYNWENYENEMSGGQSNAIRAMEGPDGIFDDIFNQFN
jgi:hypothetical protein